MHLYKENSRLRLWEAPALGSLPRGCPRFVKLRVLERSTVLMSGGSDDALAGAGAEKNERKAGEGGFDKIGPRVFDGSV